MGEAVSRLQALPKDVSVYYVYLTDERERLVGVVSLRSLLRVPASRALGGLSAEGVVSVSVRDDQEQVAEVVAACR